MSDLESFLIDTFSLDSASQIAQRSCQAVGTQSVPSTYRITKNNGEVVDIFVKTVYAQSYRSAMVMEKEELMYTVLIPDVLAFADRHCTDMGDQIRSCFPRYYGICHHKSGAQSLVLEDYNSREGEDFEPFDLPKSVTVAKNLALLNAVFLAWQQRCNPGYSREKMNKKYPAIKNFPAVFHLPELAKYAEGKKPEEMTGFKFQTMTSVVCKVLRSYLEDMEKDYAKQDEILYKLNRFEEFSPNIPLLISELRNTETNYHDMCPTLGDVHPSNIAVSRTTDKVIFVDFGLCGFSSPIMDFHWFVANAAGSVWSEANVKWLFDQYLDKFVEVAEKLGIEIDRDDLHEEFENTRGIGVVLELVFATFGLIWRLKVAGVSAQEIGDFIHGVIALDVDNRKEIKEKLEKVMSKDIREKFLPKLLKCIGDLGHEVVDEFEDIIEAYNEKKAAAGQN